MFEKYTEIAPKMNSSNAVNITFKDSRITLKSKYGKQKIFVGDDKGCVVISFDPLVYDIYHNKFFNYLCAVGVKGEPSYFLINLVWEIVCRTIEKSDNHLRWTEDGLNNMFNELYIFAKNNFCL